MDDLEGRCLYSNTTAKLMQEAMKECPVPTGIERLKQFGLLVPAVGETSTDPNDNGHDEDPGSPRRGTGVALDYAGGHFGVDR